uniref:Disease resistance R13L4/SHOC-2-like LRR domain-containing protein n=1 Tax=Leersia perrieri TaxID=77586 RepID=A0A0D9XI14_9ORYZ
MSSSKVLIVEIERVLGKVTTTLLPIDELVDEIHTDLAHLVRRKDADGGCNGNCGNGEEEKEDEEHMLPSKYIEVSLSSLQLKNDVKQLRRVLDVNPDGGHRRHQGRWRHGTSSVARRPSLDQLWCPPEYSDMTALSLESLDEKLRMCIGCLGAFPDGEAVKKRLLLHWWIGEGLVESIDAAKSCFQELLSRGLLLPAHCREYCRQVHYCRVNPSIRQQVVDAARSDGFLEFDDEGSSNPMLSTRRLCLRDNERCREAVGVRRSGTDTSGRRRWRWRRRRNDDDNGKFVTIYNINQQYVGLESINWSATTVRSLEILQIGRWRTTVEPHHVELAGGDDILLRRVFMCKNLKYLSLRGVSFVEALPESISNLCQLVVLDLRACYNLETLPSSIGSLQRLEYLDVSECLLDDMPEELRGLSNLENMPRLRKLKLCTGRHSTVAGDDELRHLVQFNNLRSLAIVWGINGVASMISLPTSLEKLDLQRTPMEDLLQFIKPSTSSSVKKLYIRGGRLRTVASDAVRWTNIEILRVGYLKNLLCEWCDLESSFPNVMVVENWECDKLSSWPCNHHGVWKKGETVARPATSFVGVCYGMRRTDLPAPMEVVELYRSNNIRLMRLYHPDHEVLSALGGTGIGIILGVGDNSILESLAYEQTAATNWVRTNVQAYSPGVQIRYIAVGNEVKTGVDMRFILPAMMNIERALASAGLGKIKVSTVVTQTILAKSYPPSIGVFHQDAQPYITSIVKFLVATDAPLLANVHPYYAYQYDGGNNIAISYALFTSPDTVVKDGSYCYQNLFDAMVDALYAALERADGNNVRIVVAESGWPRGGMMAGTAENARTYYRNLISHVGNGTPRRLGVKLETYLYSMFNEDSKQFGLFCQDKTDLHSIAFS